MAVKMRLRREGKRKQPFYRVVVADVRSPRDGRFIDDLGYYHPLKDPSEISIDHERALHWLRNGVQPSDAVLKLLRIEGIWEEFKPGDPGKDRSAKHEAAAAAAAAKAQAEKEKADAEAKAAQEQAEAEAAERAEAEAAEAAEAAAESGAESAESSEGSGDAGAEAGDGSEEETTS